MRCCVKGLSFVCVVLAVVSSHSEAMAQVFGPLKKLSDGLSFDVPKIKGLRFPRGGQSTSGTMSMEYSVDRDGWVLEQTRSDFPFRRTNQRLSPRYYPNGEAYFEYQGRRYTADTKYNNLQLARDLQRQRATQQLKDAERQHRQRQAENARQGQAWMQGLSDFQLAAQVHQLPTPQLHQAGMNNWAQLQEFRTLNLDVTGFARLDNAIRNELGQRQQEEMAFANVVSFYNPTSQPFAFEIRSAPNERFQSVSLQPGTWGRFWSRGPEARFEVRYDADLSGMTRIAAQVVEYNRVFSPDDPDMRLGHPYWFALANNGRELMLTDEMPPNNEVENVYVARPDFNPQPPFQQPVPQKPARPRRLGVQIQPVDVGNGELGLQLVSVGDGSPAQRAGLEVGDVIVRVDGTRVRSPEELVRALDQSTGNPLLKVLNVRNRQYVELTASFD